MKTCSMKLGMSAAAALLLATGCKVSVSGTGTLVNVGTGQKQPIEVSITGKSTRVCGLNLAIADEQGQSLAEMKFNSPQSGSSNDFQIDTAKTADAEDCNPDSKIQVVAQATDRVVDHQRITKWVTCGMNGMNGMNGGVQRADDPRPVRITVDTDIVQSVIEGKILDRASGKVLQTFTATSPLREVPRNGTRPTCY